MPASSNKELSAERISDPEGFFKKCHKAVDKHKGNVSAAASELGISRRTLTRYIEENGKILRGTRDSDRPPPAKKKPKARRRAKARR